MEQWDVYNQQGEITGRIMERGQVEKGDYMLAVHIYIQNQDGLWLLQKRSEKKEHLPGIWEVTGGAVLQGETSLQAALRETKEEVGLALPKENMVLVARLKRKYSFVDIWCTKAEFSLEDCVLQPEEVDDVKLVTAQQLRSLLSNPQHHRDEAYRCVVLNMIG